MDSELLATSTTTAPTYRVRDWLDHFENAESRKTKNCRWVAVPNRHDGKGYGRVAAHERAVDLFCAWTLILQVASKCPERGTLADEDGPLTAADLAMMTRFPAPIFALAFEVLIDPAIGWLTRDQSAKTPLDASNPDGVPAHPDTSGHAGTEGKGREGKSIRRRPDTSGQLPEIPGALNTPEFTVAWREWQDHRKEKRKALTRTCAAKQLRTFEEMGVSRAVKAIDHSIANGWTGCFEPDNGRPSNGQHVSAVAARRDL